MQNETMIPNNGHYDIPGNPSTAKSSNLQLNDRSNGVPLRVLSEEDWAFWKHNGYVIIKQAVPREQAQETAKFLWEFEEKDAHKHMNRLALSCKAKLAIIPLQDILGLSSDARMNTPGTSEGNWQWRAQVSDINYDALKDLHELTLLFGR